MKRTLVLLLIVATVATVYAWGSHHQDESVLLKDIEVLTFRKGEWTTARRSKAVPQLKCVGGDAKHKYEPSVVQCRNMGTDGTDNVQWKCESEMESDYKFGTTDVSCEGYRDKHDPYVLRGSCGLEYTLEYTQAGKERKAGASSSGAKRSTHEYTKQNIDSSRFVNQPDHDTVGSWRKKLGQVAVMAVVGIALFGICCGTLFKGTIRGIRNTLTGGAGAHHTATGRPHVGSIPRASAGGFYPAPPVAPSNYAPSAPGYHDDGSTAKYGASQATSGGPGFGTGMLAGAAAGYLASRVMNRSDNTQQQSPQTNTASATRYDTRSHSPIQSVPAPQTHIATGYGETKKR